MRFKLAEILIEARGKKKKERKKSITSITIPKFYACRGDPGRTKELICWTQGNNIKPVLFYTS